MAQLTDDSPASPRPPLPVAARLPRLLVTETEDAILHAAHGRVLARDINAPLDLPPLTIPLSMVTPCATASDTAPRDTTFVITGRVTAGSAASEPLAAGRPCAYSPARRFLGALTPYSCRRMSVEGETSLCRPG
jgi:molybdopterin molybdotransferase